MIELAEIDTELPLDSSGKLQCQHCGEPFTPRAGCGGKPQRFCTPECRAAFHSEAQRSQRSPTCDAPTQSGGMPRAESGFAGVLVQGRHEGDPLLMVPEAELRRIDRLGEGKPRQEEPVRHCLLAAQDAVFVERDEHGNLIIRQTAWPDDDDVVVIHRDNEQQFLDALCDALGIGSGP